MVISWSLESSRKHENKPWNINCNWKKRKKEKEKKSENCWFYYFIVIKYYFIENDHKGNDSFPKENDLRGHNWMLLAHRP